MIRKLLLTIPALLAGPVMVILTEITVFEWKLTAAIMTAIICSGIAVYFVWFRDDLPWFSKPEDSQE